ncbi:MAG: SGNH/GDSL hydrolase family protein [Clostridia bacterium]|nr:SGNH/GDSL hydrolase family protein [Clostridia bacterium]
MIIENGDRIVFAGDSVTDMGSANPVGEGLFDNLGRGYVRIIENMLVAWYPDRLIRVTNSGISGNTSRDLRGRFDRDVTGLNPQWISICIGINDVWRQFDSPAFPDYSVGIAEYESNMREMIEKSVACAKKGTFVCTPYFMEPLKEDRMRSQIDVYGDICRRLAKEYGCILVDFQKMFDDFFRFHHSSLISWDRVHPNQIGATLMAREFLDVCGFEYDRKI